MTKTSLVMILIAGLVPNTRSLPSCRMMKSLSHTFFSSILFLFVTISPIRGTGVFVRENGLWRNILVTFFTYYARSSSSLNTSPSFLTSFGGVGHEFGEDMACGDQGVCWGIGSTDSLGAGDVDMTFIKYDEKHHTLETYTLGGMQAEKGIAISAYGDTFCAIGEHETAMGTPVLALTQLNSTDRVWTKAFQGFPIQKCRGVGVMKGDQCVVACDVADLSLAQDSPTIGGKDIWVLQTNPWGAIEKSGVMGTKRDEYVHDVFIDASGETFLLITHKGVDGQLCIFMVALNSTIGLEDLKGLQGMKDISGITFRLSPKGSWVIMGEIEDVIGGKDTLLATLTPSWEKVSVKVLGGKRDDVAKEIAFWQDGTLLLGIDTRSYGVGGWDIMEVSINSQGEVIDSKVVGGREDDRLGGIEITSSGEVYLLGSTKSFTLGLQDLLLGKHSRNALSYGNTARPTIVDVSDYFSMVNLSFTVKPFIPEIVNIPMEWHRVRFEKTAIYPSKDFSFASSDATHGSEPTREDAARRLISDANVYICESADSSLSWTITGTILTSFGIIFCWGGFWVTACYERKEIKEEIKQEIKQSPVLTTDDQRNDGSATLNVSEVGQSNGLTMINLKNNENGMPTAAYTETNL